jgi:RNA polymerase sigma-70 factor, ECF subfamily
LSVEEIADQLNLPSGTVKTHLFRARDMLRERLGPVLDMDSDGRK